jgi:hypothetical protein
MSSQQVLAWKRDAPQGTFTAGLAHAGASLSAAATADGKTVLCGGQDGALSYWRVVS